MIKTALSPTILYEDDELIVVDKPSGLLVHPSGKPDQPNVVDYLKALNADDEIRPVHRLDRQTSGVLLLAKSASVARYLGDCFAQGQVDKQYLAEVKGHIPLQAGSIDLALGKDLSSDVAIKRTHCRDGEIASTEYHGLLHLEKSSLIWLKPNTGRRHQLRVHMALLNHPIVNDPIYDLGDAYYLALRSSQIIAPPMHLHAWRLTLSMQEGRRQTFEAAIPPHIATSFTGSQMMDALSQFAADRMAALKTS